MSNREVGPVAKELIAAKKRIEDPENWLPEEANILSGEDGNRFCAMRAILTNGGALSTLSVLEDSAEILHGTRNAVHVNNLGHAAVMQMYDHAIQRALSEGK